MFYLVFSAAVYSDLPYGLNLFTGDKAPTIEQMIARFRQFDAIQSADTYVIVNWHTPRDTATVLSAMERMHTHDYDHIFWHKVGNTAINQPKERIVKSVEMCTVGYYPSQAETKWLLSEEDPKKRHNHITLPSVRKLATGPNNIPINATEKPWELSYRILKMFCHIGSNVLIIGAGAGGDVMGAINAGMNVYAVEKDRVQYDALKVHLNTMLDRYTTLYDQGKNIIENDSDEEDEEEHEDPKVTPAPAATNVLETLLTQSSQSKKDTSEGKDKGSDDEDILHMCPKCNTDFETNDELVFCQYCDDKYKCAFHEKCLDTVRDADGGYYFACEFHADDIGQNHVLFNSSAGYGANN
jgi:hypothetical protein